MSKPANKTVIGFFVLGAIALAVIAIVVLGSGKFFRKTIPAVCYFEGSVGGLNVGAPVVFRGVKVGTVERVVLRGNPEKLTFEIPVYIAIDPSSVEVEGPREGRSGEALRGLVMRGLKAKLEMQSIVTGQLQIGLDMEPDKPVRLVGNKMDSGIPEIPTVPTPLQEFVKKVEKLPIDEIFEKLRSTLAEIEKVVKSPEIPKTLQSISDAAGEAKTLVKNVNSQVTPLASNANETVKDVQRLVKNVDQHVAGLRSDLGTLVTNVNNQVTPLASNANQTLVEVQKLAKDVDQQVAILASDLGALVKNVNSQVTPLASNANQTLGDVQNLVKNVDQHVAGLRSDLGALVKNVDNQVTSVASNASETLGDVRKLATNVDQHVSGLRSDLGNAVKDAQKLIQNADGEVKSVSSSVQDALKEAQNLVRNTDGRIDRLVPGIEEALQAATGALKQAQVTLKDIGAGTGEDSALIYQLTQALKELASATRSVRVLADFLERRPETAIWGK